MRCFATQVGVLRRGKYVKGKRIGKGNLVEEVGCALCLSICFSEIAGVSGAQLSMRRQWSLRRL